MSTAPRISPIAPNGPRRHRLVQDQPAQQHRHDRVHVGVGADDASPRRGAAHRRRTVNPTMEPKTTDTPGPQARGRELPLPASPSARPSSEITSPPTSICTADAGVGRRLCRVPLGVHGPERPGRTGEGEGHRTLEVAVHQLPRRHPGEERAAEEAEREPDADPPGEDAGAAGPIASKNAAQSGTAATNTLAGPDSTNCSAQTTTALPPSRRNTR